MFVFRKIWRALFSWNTRFEIHPFASHITLPIINSHIFEIIQCSLYPRLSKFLCFSQWWVFHNIIYPIKVCCLTRNDEDFMSFRETLIFSYLCRNLKKSFCNHVYKIVGWTNTAAVDHRHLKVEVAG